MKRHISSLAAIAVLLACIIAGMASGADKATAKDKAKPNNAKAGGFNLQNLIAAPINAVVREFDQRQRADKANAQRLAQNEARIKQEIPRYVQIFKPILSSELAYIRLTCDIPKEHRAKIKAAGERSLEEAARKFAEAMYVPRVNLRGVREQSDPSELIRDTLAKSLQESLTAEQLARYNAEVAHRTASRKRAAILWTVSQLDETLSLTSEQRDKIFESISHNWQVKWEQWLILHQYAGQYFPTVPDNLVVDHLNTDQKAIWNGLQKIDFGFSRQNEVQMADDDAWWGEEAADPVPPPEYDKPE